CPCPGTDPPVVAWTPECDDDLPPACGTIADTTGAACGLAGDGSRCQALAEKGDCLMAGCAASCALPSVSLATGGQWSCSERDAEQCISVGYVYCPCAEDVIDPDALYDPVCAVAE